MKKHWKWIGGIVVLLAIGGALYGWRPWATREAAFPGGDLDLGLGPTLQVGRGDVVRTLTVFGNVIPKDVFTLSFDAGRLAKFKVNEGDAVERNQVLLLFRNAQEKLTMLRAKRVLAEARAAGIPTVIQERKLEYEIAQAAYEATIIRAPFAGVVTSASRARDTVGQYQISLLNRAELLIEVMISELDIHQVALGQEGQAMIDAFPDQVWPVEIIRINYQAVQGPGFGRGRGKVVPVTVKFLKVDPAMLLGLSARVHITTAEAREVVRVPIETLIEFGPGLAVIVIEEGKPVPRPVEAGLTSDRFAEITSGLEEGEEILLMPMVPAIPSIAIDGKIIDGAWPP